MYRKVGKGGKRKKDKRSEQRRGKLITFPGACPNGKPHPGRAVWVLLGSCLYHPPEWLVYKKDLKFSVSLTCHSSCCDTHSIWTAHLCSFISLEAALAHLHLSKEPGLLGGEKETVYRKLFH